MAGLLRGARALGGLVQRLQGADVRASVRVGFSAGVPAASSRVAAAMASFAPAGGIVPARWLSASASAPSSADYVALNTISDNDGAKKTVRGCGNARSATPRSNAEETERRRGTMCWVWWVEEGVCVRVCAGLECRARVPMGPRGMRSKSSRSGG